MKLCDTISVSQLDVGLPLHIGFCSMGVWFTVAAVAAPVVSSWSASGSDRSKPNSINFHLRHLTACQGPEHILLQEQGDHNSDFVDISGDLSCYLL